MDKFVSATLFALGLVIAAPASACGTDCASGTWAADLYGRVLNRPGLLDEDRRAQRNQQSNDLIQGLRPSDNNVDCTSRVTGHAIRTRCR